MVSEGSREHAKCFPYFKASFRYAFLISSSVASRETSRISYSDGFSSDMSSDQVYQIVSIAIPAVSVRHLCPCEAEDTRFDAVLRHV